MAPPTKNFADLFARLRFLIGALIVFRICAHVPVPGVDYARLREVFDSGNSGLLDLFNLFSGGALSNASVIALGIFPYITASIIMMLGSYSLPWLEEMRKEGASGRRRITQITRYITVPLALFQSSCGQPRIALSFNGDDFNDRRRRFPDVAG